MNLVKPYRVYQDRNSKTYILDKNSSNIAEFKEDTLAELVAGLLNKYEPPKKG